MRKVFLDNMIRRKTRIDWKANIGKIVKFVYDDIKGEVTIMNYEDGYLYIKYLDKPIFKISTGNFKKLLWGALLGIKVRDFKIKIKQTFKDDKRDLTITNREYRGGHSGQKCKYYKYTCNKCGWTEGWILESQLIGNHKNKRGCSCCFGRTVVEGINSIIDTDKWMIPYFQGGFDEAKKYTKGSRSKIIPICPICHKIKDKPIVISTIYGCGSIGCKCK